MTYFEHTVGSHSDDRGGDSDLPCYCNRDTEINTDQTPPVESLDSILGQVRKILGVVRNPAFKGKKDMGWWFETELLDEDFEEVVGQQYTNADQIIKNLVALIQTSNREAVRLGQVRCAAEMSNLDQEIVSLKAEIKRLQTLTKEEL